GGSASAPPRPPVPPAPKPRKAKWYEKAWAVTKGTVKGIGGGAVDLVKGVGGLVVETGKTVYDGGQYIGRAGYGAVSGDWSAVENYKPVSFASKTSKDGKWGDVGTGIVKAVKDAPAKIAAGSKEWWGDLTSGDPARMEKASETIGKVAFDVATLVIPMTKLGKVGKVAELAEEATALAKLGRVGESAEAAAKLAEEAARLAKAARTAEEAAAAARAAEEAAKAARVAEEAAKAGKTAEEIAQAARAAREAEESARVAAEAAKAAEEAAKAGKIELAVGATRRKIAELTAEDLKQLSRTQLDELARVDPKAYEALSTRFNELTSQAAKDLRGELGDVSKKLGLPEDAVQTRGKAFDSAAKKMSEKGKPTVGDLGDLAGGRLNTRDLKQVEEALGEYLKKNPGAKVDIKFPKGDGEELAKRLRDKFPNTEIKVTDQPGYRGRVHIDGPEGPGKFKSEIQLGPKDVTEFYDGAIVKNGKPVTVNGKPVTVHDNMYKDLRKVSPEKLAEKGLDPKKVGNMIERHDQLVEEVYQATKTGPIAPNSDLARRIADFKQEFGDTILKLHAP
ncbi:MAG: hypothetical protein HZA54_14040, partial [Planctomycetes bacterium]|nr:hypothetical protein [Planctomycetota bacterium]